MFSSWFATLGAAFPSGMSGRRRAAMVADARGVPAAAPSDAVPASATVLGAPSSGAAPARARVVDPIDLKVVPFVPSDDGSTLGRMHPRILNPFRAFPNRGAHLFELMHPRDPRD